jgi:hypothetical protein
LAGSNHGTSEKEIRKEGKNSNGKIGSGVYL